MIASNYRKFPEAMALQMVLVFGAMVWHTSRPTTRATRAIRAERGRMVKAMPQVVRWVKVSTPQWWKDAKREAKALCDEVRAALVGLVWDIDAATTETAQALEVPTYRAVPAMMWGSKIKAPAFFAFRDEPMIALARTYVGLLDEEEIDGGPSWASVSTCWRHPTWKGHAHYLPGYFMHQ